MLSIALVLVLLNPFKTDQEIVPIPKQWEIHWFKDSPQHISLPIEYWSEKEARDLVYPPQRLQVRRSEQQFLFSFPEGSEFADCNLQGEMLESSKLQLTYTCDHPVHSVKQATITASLAVGYNPGQFIIDGTWVGSLHDEPEASGRVEIISTP